MTDKTSALLSICRFRDGFDKFPASCFNDEVFGKLLANRMGSVTYGVLSKEGLLDVIGREYRGRGYAAELLKAMTEYAFKTFPVGVLYGRVMRGNDASVRVLVKSGFIFAAEEAEAEDDPYGNGMLVYKRERPDGARPHQTGKLPPRPLVYIGIAMHPSAEEELSRAAEITHEPSRLPEADAVIVYSPDQKWTAPAVDESPASRVGFARLKVIACHVCEEPVLNWVRRRGITVIEAGGLHPAECPESGQLPDAGGLWRTVAEHTLALMMSAARQLPAADAAVRRGEWTDHETLKTRFSGCDFYGKTLGIWGMGQIGRELADMVRGFRMRVLYNDITRDMEAEKKLDVEFADLSAMLRESDYFALLLPLNESTRGIMGEHEFSLMKTGCVFVNSARAGIVDERAFMNAMRDGTIGYAALDVQWEEPLSHGPLLEMTNIVFAPHLGGSTYECDKILVQGVLEALGVE